MDYRQKELVKKIAIDILPKVMETAGTQLSEQGYVDAAFRIAKYFVETSDALDSE